MARATIFASLAACTGSLALLQMSAMAHHHMRAEPMPSFVSAENARLADESGVEVLELRPDMRYVKAGDVHFTVYANVRIRQSSTNFYDYAFARKPENNAVEGVRIRFLDADGREILSVPCVVTGHDMTWGMDGVRVVQFTCEFIMTHGRTDYLSGRLSRVCFSDSGGQLRRGDGGLYESELSSDAVLELVEKPLGLIRGAINRR